jgi:hypothetical protein
MRDDSITLAIFEKYKPEELAEVAQQMAQAQAELENVEVEKKVSDAAFNERIKKFAADVSTLAKKYNKGGESAQIGCDIRYDHPEPGKKSYFRMDRNELVETHDMTWEENQETIQFPLAEAPAPEPSVSDISTAALESLADAKPDEEVTRICQFPGCTHFADHDGDHNVPPPEAEATPEPTPEPPPPPKTTKPRRRPDPPIQPGAPA